MKSVLIPTVSAYELIDLGICTSNFLFKGETQYCWLGIESLFIIDAHDEAIKKYPDYLLVDITKLESIRLLQKLGNYSAIKELLKN